MNSSEQVPHAVQQIMSGERYPLLSGVIGAFRKLLMTWKDLKEDRPELAPFIDEGLYWAEKYFDLTSGSSAYNMAIGMCLSILTHCASLTHFQTSPQPAREADQSR